MKVALASAGRGDEVPSTRNEREPSVRHRRRTAVAKRAQPHAVVGADVCCNFRVTVGAVGAKAVQVRLDLAAVEEIVRADERDAPVGHDLGLVVEDECGGDGMNPRAVGVHAEQRAGRGLMIFLEGADARGREDNAAIRQFGGIDVVERSVGEPLRRAAVQRDAVDVEELFTTQRGSDEQGFSIKGGRR